MLSELPLNGSRANESLTIAGEYIEAESGKGTDALDRRPQRWPRQRQ
jgi:hypothetical protein